jgi:hypothetical protein
MTASWNQKYNLICLAKVHGHDKVLAELEARNITKQPVSEEKYKDLRNAIAYNNPAKALQILQQYPIDLNQIQVSPSGGEL